MLFRSAQAAAGVVGLVDEVAEVELGGALGTGQLHAQLLVGVVEDELVVALGLAWATAELGGLEAAQG